MNSPHSPKYRWEFFEVVSLCILLNILRHGKAYSTNTIICNNFWTYYIISCFVSICLWIFDMLTYLKERNNKIYSLCILYTYMVIFTVLDTYYTKYFRLLCGWKIVNEFHAPQIAILQKHAKTICKKCWVIYH